MAFWNRAKTAAVAPLVGGGPSPIEPIPGRRVSDPRQDRARFYAQRIGFVRNSYRFLAYQAARCPLTIEVSDDGVDWEAADVEDQPWAYDALHNIRPPSGNQSDLVREAVFLDDTVGEYYLIDVTSQQKASNRAAFIIRDVAVCKREKQGFTVLSAPGGRVREGTAQVVDLKNVYRHWQRDEEFDLQATSSLMGMVDDIDTYWALCRQLRRESRSRLAMGNIFWTPSEAHTEMKMVNGEKVSVLNYEYAMAAITALNDIDDREVASASPLSINSPGSLHVPQVIKIPSLGTELLDYLKDHRMLIASGLPLSTAAILEGAAAQKLNHWSDWLADEKDLQTISERLRRVLDSWTEILLRPTLTIGDRTGAWSGDPELVRIGFDADVIRRNLDNSANAMWAWTGGLITDEAARRELHFKETDKPDDKQLAEMVKVRTMFGGGAAPEADPSSGAPALPKPANPDAKPTDRGLGAGGGQQQTAIGPPNKGNAPTPADGTKEIATAGADAAKSAGLVVIDDSFLFRE